MYNKTCCSTDHNSSFLKRSLVRLLCQRKPVVSDSRSVTSATEKSTYNNVRQCRICPLKQCSNWNTVAVYQPSDLDSNGQPGDHAAPSVRECRSDWTKKKKLPSVQQGDLLGMKHADAWRASKAKQSMDAAVR